jgi:polar amino acid transport system permease protein
MGAPRPAIGERGALMSNTAPKLETPLETPLDTFSIHKEGGPPFRLRDMPPHRIVLVLIGLALVASAAIFMRWDWLPSYGGLILQGLWRTIWILVVTVVLGFLLAVPLGLAQAAGPAIFAIPARWFCTVIRGTPLLLQLWLLYYGLGSLFPQYPWIRGSELWPYLRQAWPYAVLALTLSYAGYEGEVMRGAFAGVPKGQLEAARAFGMRRFTILRRIWLPQAIHRALPTLAGEAVLQLKSTPLVATITVVDLYSVASRVRQDTFITYEPLLLLAAGYLIITGIIVFLFRKLERLIPSRLG